MKQQQWTLIAGSVSNVHMDMNGEEEDSNQSEVDDGVDHDGDAAGLQVAELDQAALAGGLEHEARREKNEQYHCHEHWPPVCHLFLLLLLLLLLPMLMLYMRGDEGGVGGEESGGKLHGNGIKAAGGEIQNPCTKVTTHASPNHLMFFPALAWLYFSTIVVSTHHLQLHGSLCLPPLVGALQKRVKVLSTLLNACIFQPEEIHILLLHSPPYSWKKILPNKCH